MPSECGSGEPKRQRCVLEHRQESFLREHPDALDGRELGVRRARRLTAKLDRQVADDRPAALTRVVVENERATSSQLGQSGPQGRLEADTD